MPRLPDGSCDRAAICREPYRRCRRMRPTGWAFPSPLGEVANSREAALAVAGYAAEWAIPSPRADRSSGGSQHGSCVTAHQDDYEA